MQNLLRSESNLQAIDELKRLYKRKILPLEQAYRFDLFYSPHVSDAEFDSKPQVMLLGQYSVGKTTFIRYILGEDIPGQRIGPEPTTDKFTAIFYGPDKRIIPGNALAVNQEMPFRGLERFGVSFLNRFEGAQLNNKVLENITFIDTPGVLSGEKQRLNRGYNFCEVCEWFAKRSDLILLLFDSYKLDISDEFKSSILALKGNEDKIRCILNKADQVDSQKLMRIYGALMWSLGKIIQSPEVLRVYISSFWIKPYANTENRALFDKEKSDLFEDLRDLPKYSIIRKINELVKRVRLAKVHAYIISHLKDQMPMIMGQSKKQEKLISNLGETFRILLKKYNLSIGDFPDIEEYKSKLSEFQFSKFNSLKMKLINDAETALGIDIPKLMAKLPQPTSDLYVNRNVEIEELNEEHEAENTKINGKYSIQYHEDEELKGSEEIY